MSLNPSIERTATSFQIWNLGLTPKIVPRQVNLWRLRVDRDWESIRPFLRWLDKPEQNRAKQYRFKQDAICFIFTRAYLRAVLGTALGIDPAAVIFGYEPTGKPILSGGQDLWFSVSHSGAYAVIAIALHRVGVDIEHVRPIPIHDLIKYFSRYESPRILALPERDRLSAFFRCWTRKEAYLKARGEGISFGLSRFTVTVGLNERPGLVIVDEEPMSLRDGNYAIF
jgi:4'-phosphopantetheinyl transferase